MTILSKTDYPAGSRWWFFLTAFTTGGVVMALEILGSRLLAPVFGTSLFVWGALIGVVLAAMSTGYAMGGWLADRRAPGIVVTILLLGAGVWTLLLAGAGGAQHARGHGLLLLAGQPAPCLSGPAAGRV